MKIDTIVLKTELDQFSGTENYWRWSHMYPRFVITDGVKHLAERAQCYWLLDIICSWQCQKEVWDQPFQVWQIKVTDQTVTNRNFPNEPIHTRSAVVWCEDGNEHEVARQEMEYTDFPLLEMKIYAIYDDGYRTNINSRLVILLTNEY